MLKLEPYSPEQKRCLSEASALWQSRAPLLLAQRELVGGLQWKTIAEKEYLYRYHPDPITHKKRSTSLGRRSPETEAAYAEFMQRRSSVEAALQSTDEMASAHARAAKALRLGRFPIEVAHGMRALWLSQVMDHLMLVSEHAVHGYESQFHARIGNASSYEELHFCTASDDVFPEILPGLQQALTAWDKSVVFTRSEAGLTAKGKSFVAQFSPPSYFISRWAAEYDAGWEPMEILQQLLEMDPIAVLTIARDGSPAPIQVPDPRAFAFMCAPAQSDLSRLGMAVAKLADRVDDFAFRSDVLELMPELSEALGRDQHGPRI